MRKSEFLLVLARIAADAAALFLALLAAYFLRMEFFWVLGIGAPTTLFPFSIFCVFSAKITAFLLLIFALHGRYRFFADAKFWQEIQSVFWAFSSGMAVLIVLFFFSQFLFFSRFIFGVAWILGLLFLIFGRMGVRALRNFAGSRGIGRSKIVLLGTGDIAKNVLPVLQKNSQLEILGVLSEKKIVAKKWETVKVLGSFADLEKVLTQSRPDEIFLAHHSESENQTPKLAKIAHTNHVRFHVFPDEIGLDLAAVSISTFGAFPIITLLANKIEGWGLVVKSLVDYAVAATAIVILSPLFLFLAFRIKKDGGPVFYTSERIGKNGKPFPCIKFRSMVVDAEQKKTTLLEQNQRAGGVLFKIQNDPRITPFGAFLRKWSLDELPNLLNVLRGEMSLIGPRPHLPAEVQKYSKEDRRVLAVKPGITGFAQINGRSSLSFREEMGFEIFYLKNWNLWLDAIIFFKTLFLICKRENAD